MRGPWRRRGPQREKSEDGRAALPSLLRSVARLAAGPGKAPLDEAQGLSPTKASEQYFGGSQASTQACSSARTGVSWAASDSGLADGLPRHCDAANRPPSPCETDITIGFDDSASMVMVRNDNILVQSIQRERADRERVRTFLAKHGFRGVGARQSSLFGTAFFYPLHRAVRLNDAQMTKLLLSSGANAQQADSRGRTPYQYAQWLDRGGSHEEVVAVLRAADA